jgi:aspartyl-tRNA(Asn)/glutamyl-tRNA(Gln) amidotransferase subunit A
MITIVEAAKQLREGTLTSRELTEACLERIERDNPRLNAFITVTADLARTQADHADRELKSGADHDRGPLHGIPISIKDLIDIEGLPTTAASKVREGHVARRDAAIITNLRKAGAVFVGKTNLHEFAMGTTTEESAFGPAHHPQDPARSPGGSSGGSAAAVAAGMCLATVGSDTGGSIRIPSSVCGLVGLKPAWNDLSLDGVVPLAGTLDVVGPLALTVEDAYIVYAAMAGREPVVAPVAPQTLRFGVLRGYATEKLQAEVRARFDAALARLREAGAAAAASESPVPVAAVVLEPIELPHLRLAPSIYLPTVLAEGAEYHARTLERLPEKYTPGVRLRFELGRYVLAEDYLRAQRGRAVLRAEVDAALDSVDALILPTLPIIAPPIGATTVPMDDGREEPVRAAMLRLTQPFNLTGHPAVSVPLPEASDAAGAVPGATGLPCGLQVVARDLPRVLAAAGWCERMLTVK